MSLISIIVPVYNVEKYLDKCLNTIRNQTYSNLEIIVVNDGSPDNSDTIIQKHAELDQRIQIVNKKNGGLSSARNAGLKVAKGDYYAFIDSDDWIELDMMEQLYQSISTNSADIALCNVSTDFENGEVKTILKQGTTLPDAFDVSDHEDGFMNFDCFACNKLFKKHIFQDDSIQFPEGLLYEDIGTFPRLYIRAKRISIVRKNLYHYIVREGAITQTFKLKGLDYLKVTDLIEKEFNKPKFHAFLPHIESFKIQHNFYSLAINCGWIPITKDRNLAINTVQAYYKNQNWTWRQVKEAKFGNTTFSSLRSKPQKIYYWLFWHVNPLLKLLFSIFHKIK